MMIKVAICDADVSVRRQIEHVTGQIQEIRQCDWYPDPSSLIKILELGNVPYQVILISLEWDPGRDWVKMVREIRDQCPFAKMVYMAECPQRFVEQIFIREILPGGFLVKPLEQRAVTECFARLLGEMEPEPGCGLLIRRRGRIQSIDFREIVYLESVGHLVEIRTRGGRYDCYGRLQKLKEQLTEDFIQCHKSYVVNMRRVRQIEGRWIVVESGERIPISKSRYPITRKCYTDFMARESSEESET